MGFRTSLVIHWLRLSSQCRVPGSIPGWGTKSYMPQLNTPHAVNKTWCNQRKKKKSILVGFLHVLCQAPTPTVAPPSPPPTTCLLSAFAFPLQSFCLHPTPLPTPVLYVLPPKLGHIGSAYASRGCSCHLVGAPNPALIRVMSSGRSRRLFL